LCAHPKKKDPHKLKKNLWRRDARKKNFPSRERCAQIVLTHTKRTRREREKNRTWARQMAVAVEDLWQRALEVNVLHRLDTAPPPEDGTRKPLSSDNRVAPSSSYVTSMLRKLDPSTVSTSLPFGSLDAGTEPNGTATIGVHTPFHFDSLDTLTGLEELQLHREKTLLHREKTLLHQEKTLLHRMNCHRPKERFADRLESGVERDAQW